MPTSDEFAPKRLEFPVSSERSVIAHSRCVAVDRQQGGSLKTPVTANTALRLAHYFDTTPAF